MLSRVEAEAARNARVTSPGAFVAYLTSVLRYYDVTSRCPLHTVLEGISPENRLNKRSSTLSQNEG